MDSTTTQQRTSHQCKFVSFNCKNVKRSIESVAQLCKQCDVISLQETWLMSHDLQMLGTIDADFGFTGSSAVGTSAGTLRGRPYGGVALLWRKSLFPNVTIIQCDSARLVAIKIDVCDRSLLVFSIYMPTDSHENLADFVDCMSEINAIIDSCSIESVFILGDWNSHPETLFWNEMMNFCSDQDWLCADRELLPTDTYTYISDVHNCRRWLDHCIVTRAARQSVVGAKVHYDVFWSDHFPLEIICDLIVIKQKITLPSTPHNKAVWGERDASQIEKYTALCDSKLRHIDFPQEFEYCCDGMCNNNEHCEMINKMYFNIVEVLSEAASSSKTVGRAKQCRKIIGWNKHVQDVHREARLCFQLWVLNGKPQSGKIYEDMSESRKRFKAKLKWCQNNEDQIKMDILASHHKAKDFSSFWKQTNKLNPRASLPVSVDGASEPRDIANLFRKHFRVESPLGPGAARSVLDAGDRCSGGSAPVRVTPEQVAKIIKRMTRGKSPGHDGLSIEHLQCAGVHLPRVLAMFYTFCIRHSYLPADLMKTIVVPVIKNKTGDASDKGNYRPISLATIIAKVLDSVLDIYMDQHSGLNDGQFGFRPGLSTEAAVLCLKHAVRYYTDRGTPVYACFLDLSKAFDLVSYDILWDKLRNETKLPGELTALFKYWYSNQINSARWAGTMSDV